MLRDALTEAELQALLGDEAESWTPPPADEQEEGAPADGDRWLLHALVRNQLRLTHRIEELHAEVLRLKSAETMRRSVLETATGLEPLPLPFMKQTPDREESSAPPEPPSDPVPDMSRKERFKRQSRW